MCILLTGKIDPRLPECEHPITGRSLDKYAKHFPKLQISPKLQYVEVGAGLGALIPSLVSGFDGKLRPPVIIDPANYLVMKEMLEYALRKN